MAKRKQDSEAYKDFKRCEKLAMKIMDECNVKIPFLTWGFMTYEELLDLEEELKNKYK